MDIRQESIKKTVDYIENNLNEQLNLNEIAKVASYSPYHFSRIFKQVTGENLNNMIKRLRLAQSTKELMYDKSAITHVGLNVGYETPSSFNKAFKQLFGISPTEYKKKTKENLKKYLKQLKTSPEIIDISKEISVFYGRCLGEYGYAATESWGKLIKKVESDNMKLCNKRYFGLCYDNPNITQFNQMRYEACITVDKQEIDYIDKKKLKVLPKGEYAILKYDGSYDSLYDIWLQFYGWIDKENLQLDNFPPIEEYLENPKDIINGKISKTTTILMLKLKPSF
jgi:AraC family transcriptional regulator